MKSQFISETDAYTYTFHKCVIIVYCVINNFIGFFYEYCTFI